MLVRFNGPLVSATSVMGGASVISAVASQQSVP